MSMQTREIPQTLGVTTNYAERAIAKTNNEMLTIQEFIKHTEYPIDMLYVNKFWHNIADDKLVHLNIDLIKMIGFTGTTDKIIKAQCIRLLVKSLQAKEGVDYIKLMGSTSATHKKGQIPVEYYLKPECFKRLLLKARVSGVEQVRNRYILVERLYDIYESYKVIFKEKQSLVQYEEKEEADDRITFEYMFDNQSIQIFKSNNDKFMFIGKQIAKLLGYKNTAGSILKHVKPRNKVYFEQIQKVPNLGTLPNMHPQTILIDEAGLYTLMLRSKLEIAERFQIWVTEDIIPSVRRTGEYKLQKQLQLQQVEHQKQLANYEREMERLKRLANLPRIDEKISTDSLLYIATNSEMMKQNIFKVGHVKRATHKAMKERLHTYRTGYADPLRLVKLYVVRNATAIDAFFKDISQHYKQPADKAKELVTMPYEWLCAYLDKLTINNQSIIEDINARTMNEYEQAMAKQPDIQFLSDEEWPGQANIEPQEEEKRDTPDYIKPDQTIDYNKFIDKILRANGIKEGAKVQWIKFKKLSTTEKKQYNINIDYDQVKNTIKDKAESYKITFKCTK